MTPKKIHYCWFGTKPKPESFRRWLDTWRAKLPDYEINEWNERNFDVNCCRYCRQAYASRNFAFVSDVCRVYALYTEGGIYLDTDIEVLRSFDDLLEGNGYVGMESELIGTGVMIAPKGAKWVKAFYDYYRVTNFFNFWGHNVRTPNTKILTYKVIPSLPEEDRPVIFPLGYFLGIEWKSGAAQPTENTYAIHHYDASWRYKKSLSQKLKAIREGLAIRYGKK